MFQHSATRRWLRFDMPTADPEKDVSTLSHPKVAARYADSFKGMREVSTLSHPKVAAEIRGKYRDHLKVSTLSHPKVAARYRFR